MTNKSDKFSDDGVTRFERDAYGIGASYDLGGGAKVVGGYVSRDDSGTVSVGTATEGKQDAFDLGVSFTF